MHAVVRIRGSIGAPEDVKVTLKLLRLNKTNHCVLVPASEQYEGMLQKAKEYITWGKVDAQTIEKLIKHRGRLIGSGMVNDEYINSNTGYSSIEEISTAISKNDFLYKNIPEVKPVFRLSPPKHGYKSVKRPYRDHGDLGVRDDNGIKKLISVMV